MSSVNSHAIPQAASKPVEQLASQALQHMTTQPRATSFLQAALSSHKLSHAYLFVGATSVERAQLAQALAQSLVCPQVGDTTCHECLRVAHRSHPDVHWYAPAGVAGYLVSQVHDLIADVAMAPVRAANKLYIVQDADMLFDSSANALLKTIEEPPATTVFVLLARSLQSVLPTIVSRCQIIPLVQTCDADALPAVQSVSGICDERAAIALALTGNAADAIAFLASPLRQEARRQVLDLLFRLAHMNAWEILQAAQALTELVMPASTKTSTKTAMKSTAKASTASDIDGSSADEPTDEELHEASIQEQYLSKKAQSTIEAQKKRERTSQNRLGMIEVLNVIQRVLRDALLCCEHMEQSVENTDVAHEIVRLARTTNSQAVLEALKVTDVAIRDIQQNVSPQLALEVMLLSAKEAL